MPTVGKLVCDVVLCVTTLAAGADLLATLLGRVMAARYAQRLIVVASLAHPDDSERAYRYCRDVALGVGVTPLVWFPWQTYSYVEQLYGSRQAKHHFLHLMSEQRRRAHGLRPPGWEG